MRDDLLTQQVAPMAAPGLGISKGVNLDTAIDLIRPALPLEQLRPTMGNSSVSKTVTAQELHGVSNNSRKQALPWPSENTPDVCELHPTPMFPSWPS